jgi:hypothetical protein
VRPLDRQYGSMRRTHSAISLWDIPLTATKADIQTFFKRHLPGCDPFVRPLVHDPKSRTQSTIVTFKRGEGGAALALLKRETVLLDSVGTISHLGFSTSFHDLTLLESTAEEASFEYASLAAYGKFSDTL